MDEYDCIQIYVFSVFNHKTFVINDYLVILNVIYFVCLFFKVAFFQSRSTGYPISSEPWLNIAGKFMLLSLKLTVYIVLLNCNIIEIDDQFSYLFICCILFLQRWPAHFQLTSTDSPILLIFIVVSIEKVSYYN